jgi:N-acetyl-anhydromuramoyl-L-alanine amidase
VSPPRWRGGWWRPAAAFASPHFNARPPGAVIDLVVIHSISLPPGRYGGSAVERLFMGTLDPDAHPSFAPLRGLRVSAHFVIRRRGEVQQFVSCEQRAWHAGASVWRGRENCNDFSIGIELEGLEGRRFTPAQMARLATLLRALRRRHPLAAVVGHEHVAPGRKRDPGAGFDWAGLRARLGWRGVQVGMPVQGSIGAARQEEKNASGSA